MTKEALRYRQRCDAQNCERERDVAPQDIRSLGWEVRDDVPGIGLDVCPDHVHMGSLTILEEWV